MTTWDIWDISGWLLALMGLRWAAVVYNESVEYHFIVVEQRVPKIKISKHNSLLDNIPNLGALSKREWVFWTVH